MPEEPETEEAREKRKQAWNLLKASQPPPESWEEQPESAYDVQRRYEHDRPPHHGG